MQIRRLMVLAVAAAMAGAVWAETEESSSTVRHWYAERVWQKQREVAALKGKVVDLVMIGDSITHRIEKNNPAQWAKFTEGLTALNLGYDGDRTQHVIWRIDHGELDGYAAKAVTIMIGTNNNSAETTDPANTAAAIRKIVGMVREKQPKATIILHAIFPRGVSAESTQAPRRARNDATNALIKDFAEKDGNIVWLDLTNKFTDATGWVPQSLMRDELHPTAAGYEIWSRELMPIVKQISKTQGESNE